ncbi:unnamed protein product [Effrenium voratum]|nr:unnamed protein product [Effrenium voratum]
MAAVRGALTADFVQSTAATVRFGALLPSLHLVDGAEPAAWRAVAYLLRCRAGGFMVLLPDDPKVLGTLRDFVPEEDEAAAAMEPTMVQMESSRGRAVGELRVLMADLPWGYLCLFRRAAALRNSPIQLVRLEVAGAACRPQSQSALEAAEKWIAEVLDLDTAAEYQTGVEDADEGGLVDEEDELVPNDPVNPTVQALLERISRLEGALQSRAEETVAPAAPLTGGGGPAPRMLFSSQSQPLTPGELSKLKAAAGPPPGRIGRFERFAAPAERPTPSATAFAEAQFEVAEDAENLNLPTDSGAVTDPIHKMLLLQMQQTNALVQQLLQRPSDPFHGLLTGADSASGSSGGGVTVKGYAAREVFLRQLEDEAKVVEVVRKNARNELGVSEDREEPSLMRQYVEQRMALGDHKTLTQFGVILAWGWEQADRTKNTQMLSFIARALVYVEQATLDQGRTALAWLMTGLAEPNYQQLAINRRRPGLTPFARLPAPAWVAANVSFLKDIDTFESRLRQIGVGGKGKGQAGADAAKNEGDEEESLHRPRWKQKKPKGGGKAAGNQELGG